MSDAMKRCSKCGEDKALSAFSPFGPLRPGKFKSSCKACAAAYAMASYHANGGYAHVREKRDPAKVAERARAWRAANPDRAREVSRNSARKRLARMSAELNAARRADRRAAPKKYRAQYEKRYARDREKILAASKRYREANPEKKSEQSRVWRLANAERKRAAARVHYQQNKERWRAYGAARKAAKLNATPAWAELAAIREFYMSTPEGHQVDHIVPLQGKTVCGLHVLANLQYLTVSENASKRHLYWPDMPQRERRAA
jgi:hypothetical protein